MSARAGGYTILEVMIFLAISGLIFVSAAVAFGGRQKRVQYTQSMRDFEGQVVDALNDVTTGYYPSSSGYRCTVSAGSPVLTPNGSGPSTEQGSSDSCISIGKAFFFNVSGASNDSFVLMPLVGARPSLSASQSSAESTNPVAAYSNTPGQEVDLSESKALKFGLNVESIRDAQNTNTQYSSFAVASGFDGTAESRKNGITNVTLYAMRGTVGRTIDNYVTGLNGLAPPPTVKPTGGIVLCLISPDNKRARVYIGENGSATSVRSELDITSGVCA